MDTLQPVTLDVLYEQDETAWLEATAELIAHQRYSEIDHTHLAEYLTEMAGRDRREVLSRLVVLMTHLLKWEHQPEQRSNSWRASLFEQRTQLHDLLESGALRRHAEAVYEKAYSRARKQAAVETGLTLSVLPVAPVWTLDELLRED